MAPPPGAPIIPNSAAAVVSMAPNKQTNLPSVCVWFVLFPIPLLTEILGGNEEEGPLAYSTLCASFPATPPSFTTTNSTTKFRIPAFTKYSPRPTSPQHQLATFHKLKKNIHTNTQYTHIHKNDIINIHKHHQDKHKHNHKHIQIDIRGKFRHFSNYPFQLPPPILYSPNPVIPSTDTPHTFTRLA